MYYFAFWAGFYKKGFAVVGDGEGECDQQEHRTQQ